MRLPADRQKRRKEISCEESVYKNRGGGRRGGGEVTVEHQGDSVREESFRTLTMLVRRVKRGQVVARRVDHLETIPAIHIVVIVLATGGSKRGISLSVRTMIQSATPY